MVVKTPTVAFDIGTYQSSVSVWLNGKVVIIPNQEGQTSLPTYISFGEHDRLIGNAAKGQIALNPRNTIWNFKRLLGLKYNDANVVQNIENVEYRVIDDYGNAKIQVEFKRELRQFAPEELTSMILINLKETAEKYLGCKIRDALITVPTSFNDSQRQATRDAGLIAGLNVTRLLNETTSAALAYGFNKHFEDERNIFVFNMGGGSFDASIVTISDGTLYDVRATSGDTHLGGIDFTNKLLEYFLKEFSRKYDRNLRYNSRALERLRNAVDNCKHTLSVCPQAIIDIDSLYEGIDFFTKISRRKFEKLSMNFYNIILNTVESVLSDAKMCKHDIHDVVLVGGASRMPKIQSLLDSYFGKELHVLNNQQVAYGAGIQAGILSGDGSNRIENVLLLDTASKTLGIETAGGVMTSIIQKNSRIPHKATRIFTTHADNQPSVNIKIYEGDRALTKDNYLLGNFELTGIPLTLRGVPKIEVTFNLDVNGILNVSATDTSTERPENIKITNTNGRLSESIIHQLFMEAESYKVEEEKQKSDRTARNQLENYVINMRQAIMDAGENLTNDDKNLVREECECCLKWLDSDTASTKLDYEDKLRDLMRICNPIIAKIFAPIAPLPQTSCAFEIRHYSRHDSVIIEEID